MAKPQYVKPEEQVCLVCKEKDDEITRLKQMIAGLELRIKALRRNR